MKSPLTVILFMVTGALCIIDSLRLFFNASISLTATLGLAFVSLAFLVVIIRQTSLSRSEQQDTKQLISILDATQESLGVAICSVVKAGSHCQSLAVHTRRFFGLPSIGKVTFKDLLDLIHPDDLDGFLKDNETFFEQPLQEGQVRFNRVEFRIRRPEGEWNWISAERVVSLHNGNTNRFVIYRDIQKERELALKLKQVAKTSESNLLDVSHEIRTPLNAIVGLCSLLSDTRLTKRQNDYVRKISSSADTLETLIRNLLDLKRLESGQLLVESTAFNTEELFEQITPLHQYSADAKGLRFLVDISPNLPTTITSDRQMILQILNNLIRNAVKFTDAGTVEMSACYLSDSLLGHALHIEVRDTGPGIHPQDQESIFEKFNRGTALNQLEGSGLGLSIVRKFTEALGGRVELESKLGYGSTFSVFIPVEIEDESTLMDQLLQDSLSSLRVLVIERRKVVASHIANQLLPWVKCVDTVSDKEAALETIICGSYDIVILGHFKTSEEVISFKLKLDTLEDQHPKLILLEGSDNVLNDEVQDCADGLISAPFNLMKFARAELDLIDDSHTFEAGSLAGSRYLNGSGLINLRVLVAEDNEINQQVVKEHLLNYGAVVHVVSDGLQAIEALQKGEFDVVLMDIEMPYLDGLTAAERIKSQVAWKELPIIALSAGITSAQKERAKQAGMCDFIGKPYKFNDLSRAIENALRNRDSSLAPLQPGLFEIESSSNESEFVFTEIDLKLAEEYWPRSNLLVQNFRRFRQMYPEANQLFDMNDIEVSKKMTHTLKGATGFLGMSSYSAALGAFNHALTQGTATREMCEGLIQQHTRVLYEIEAYLAESE